MSSLFSGIEKAPPIEVFYISQACKDNPNPKKVNLTVGAYRTDEGLPWVLPVVNTVENQIATDNTLNKEYLPITGLTDFCNASVRILLGESNPLIAENKVRGVQALGGTGAVFLALAFLKKCMNRDVVYISKPTWPNHRSIAKNLNYGTVNEYRYWDAANRKIDFDGLVEDLSGAPDNAVVILHAVAHNPTGMDLSKEQWMQLAPIINAKNLFPLFDIAYQGFASGDLDTDAFAVRYFAKERFEMFVAQSFSKNFGLYNERVGNLALIGNDSQALDRVMSQLTLIIRQVYSNPPSHGARIVSTVLNNPALQIEWKSNVKSMADRVKLMRQALFQKLRSLGTPGTWNHIVDQIGMFSYTGLNKRQVEHLRNQFSIFMLTDGRINMCGLNNSNIDYVANAIHETVTKVDDTPEV